MYLKMQSLTTQEIRFMAARGKYDGRSEREKDYTFG